MSENKIDEYLNASFDGIGRITDINAAVGAPIQTPSGVTVIPISRVTMGFAGGSVDYTAKRLSAQKNSGGGGGTGVSIIPMAFLTVGPNAEIKVIPLSEHTGKIDRILDVIENAPSTIERIKDALT